MIKILAQTNIISISYDAKPEFLGPVLAQPASYNDSPFWQANQGWWRHTNTYFDGDLNYKIREYHSLIHIS